MPINHRITLGVLSLLLLSPSLFAAPLTDLPPAPSPDTAIKLAEPEDGTAPTAFTRIESGRALNLGQLESIQAETVLYEAQLARAKALNELQKNGYDRSLAPPFDPAPPTEDNKTDVKGAVQNTIPPQIVEITGNGTSYLAVLTLSNGNQVSVQTGNRIPGTEYVVKRVNLNEVVVTDKNQSLISLSFAG